MNIAFRSVLASVVFIAITSCLPLHAQHLPGQLSIEKNNFSTFTRNYSNRGKLWTARNRNYLNHPDAKLRDKYSPNSNAVELFEKRTIDSKSYIDQDTPTICYVQRSSSPIHFKRGGQWITIDARLRTKGPSLFEASSQEDPVGFDIKRKSSYIVTPDGKTYFNNWKLYGEKRGVRSLVAKADWTYYSAGDDGISIKNIFPGIDAEMKISRGSIKTNFIIHVNKFTQYDNLLFSDSFAGERLGKLSFANGISGNRLATAVEFHLGASTVFSIKEGVMYPEKYSSSNYQLVPYIIDQSTLTLSVNSDSLRSLLKIGDVIIDPLVQDSRTLDKAKIKGSKLNKDCSFKDACDYDFPVQMPAGATFVDALFSFGFNAFAPCTLEDGAFSFEINNKCSSKIYTGTGSGTGSQFFKNERIVLDNGGSIANCFPKPGPKNCKDPQDIPFRFSFFRKCHGPKDCDGSCIGAAEDLTITLVGRTFDSATLVASSLSVCAGAPVTLTAQGFYGIPPYHFKWAGLNADDKSIVTVTPANTSTYQAQITDACKGAGSGGDPITKSIAVAVVTSSTPTISIATSSQTICSGGNVTFKATTSNAGNSPNYQWLVNGKKVGTNSPEFSTTVLANNDAVSCVVSSGGDCGSGSATSNTIVINVSAGISPTFNAIGPLCQNSTPPVLPTLSKEGIVGIWTPSVINTSEIGTSDYTFTPAGIAICSAPVKLRVTIVASLTPTFPTIADAYCQNISPPELPGTSSEGISGTWNPSSINTADVGSTNYTFTPDDRQCGTQSKITVVVNPLPTLSMGPDITIVPGKSATLNISVTGNIVSYQWSPTVGLSDPTIKDPVANPSSSTTYKVDVIDENQCEASGNLNVIVSGGAVRIFVPNAFSPNGDGVNDSWNISNLSAYPGATIDVFNRYGQLVFHSENYSRPWDGTYNGNVLPLATYYYVIDPKNKEKKISGSVTILK